MPAGKGARPETIGICAPADPHLLAQAVGQDPAGVPCGLGGTPINWLCAELVRRGWQVNLYTVSRDISAECSFDWGSLRVHVGPCRTRHLARNLYRPEIASMRRLIERSPSSMIHAHWTYEFALAALATGIPTLVSIHDLPWRVLANFRDMHRAARLLMSYQVAVRGKHFTAVSEDAARHFRRFLKPGAQIDVVPNGLPDAVLEVGKNVRACGDGAVFATVLQGWNRLKNPSAALQAFKIVRCKLPEARLLMFGYDFEPGGVAERWAKQHAMESGVTFVGVLPNSELLRRMSREAEILVHPSLDESFCMAAAEAMALRKPVIAGLRTRGVREVLGYGTAGLLVDVKDPEAIADAMLRLAQDAGFRARVADAGYERVSQLYRLETVVAQYEHLYRRILQ